MHKHEAVQREHAGQVVLSAEFAAERRRAVMEDAKALGIRDGIP